jgi:hypothetical protein
VRGHPDEAAVLPSRRPSMREQLAGTFFERPDATSTEQRRLDDERFHRWLDTPDGRMAWPWIVERALLWASAGEKRCGVKSLVERCRDELHVHIDNRWTAAMARKLVDDHPPLRKLIRLKERSGSGA